MLTPWSRQAETVAYALKWCNSYLNDGGFAILLDDQVITRPNIWLRLHQLLFLEGNETELVKLFTPDNLNGWSWENLFSQQIPCALAGALLILVVFLRQTRSLRSRDKSYILVYVGLFVTCSLMCFVALRLVPRQVGSTLFPQMGRPYLIDGARMDTNQALAFPKARLSALSQFLCEQADFSQVPVSTDELLSRWISGASGSGRLRTVVPSLWQNIGPKMLMDTAFGDEYVPRAVHPSLSMNGAWSDQGSVSMSKVELETLLKRMAAGNPGRVISRDPPWLDIVNLTSFFL